ncbi:FKBP-type peptidyl-prolyl cis-trans isomerase N-terminal domain-containing protein [Legionella clemsonensis]|uniref:Peptidyl-prolyl cis-trans isomerase n=1 Tax=Legionella clemsonensis TaxID=1867846 RepID=A0A1B0THI1_9GAMM|nr:FKBP-type peptidyl-prolyl cis-trans isomerase [Legionella clemsonensis]ALL55643.1 macrophage infectivity potentiator [Legionella clemsonensis]ASQ46391.1 Outer membrane protein MIP precursor [Legionella clemsonensis]
MKMRLVAAAVIGLTMSTAIVAADASTTTTTPATSATPATSLNSDMDKLSYSIGADLGKNFKKQGIDINPAAMAKGLQDGMTGGQLLLTEQQMKDVLNKFQKDLMAKRNAEFNKKAEENKAKGEAFLNQNKAKDGVVSLPSGLQYKILQKGDGAKPSKEDTVTVEYTGKLIDGQVFDSTDRTGKPATFKVSQVIPGWTEALQLMPAGSTWEVYVPADLAYGPRSVGGPIGPNETLIFKIHLISVKKSDA